ncbi:hypothetical protein KFE98_03335 [bacterium SCSIO 12741]|nr:hypothetical protein KFE98_03335 [bacterium SCSIO 12741]
MIDTIQLKNGETRSRQVVWVIKICMVFILIFGPWVFLSNQLLAFVIFVAIVLLGALTYSHHTTFYLSKGRMELKPIVFWVVPFGKTQRWTKSDMDSVVLSDNVVKGRVVSPLNSWNGGNTYRKSYDQYGIYLRSSKLKKVILIQTYFDYSQALELTQKIAKRWECELVDRYAIKMEAGRVARMKRRAAGRR